MFVVITITERLHTKRLTECQCELAYYIDLYFLTITQFPFPNRRARFRARQLFVTVYICLINVRKII